MKTHKKAVHAVFSTPNLAVSAMAFAIATAVSPGAVAQQKDSTLALEEVMVTARKREESIQDIPVSVTSIGKELKEASIRRLDDIQSFTPNVYLRPHGAAPGGLSVAIRGVSSSEYDKSFDPAISVIMDGMFIGTASGSMLSNFDTQRIEVLRGPQGTLFGKNTTGGVINVIRGAVTQEWGGDFSATVGEDGREDFKGVLNVPVIDDKLGVKLFGNSINSDGAIKNKTLNDDAAGEDYQTYGFASLWTPTENIDLKFHYENYQDDSETGAYRNENGSWVDKGALACGLEGVLWPVGCKDSDPDSDRDNVTGARKNTGDSETDMYILTANWDIDSMLLTSITAYRDVDEHYLNNFDPSPADFLYLDYFNDWEQFSQELRVTSQFSDTFEFVAGLYYWDVQYEQSWDVGRLYYNLDRIGAITGVPGGAGFNEDTLSFNGQKQDTTSYAAYFSSDWHINEQWTINAGLRYTYEEKDFSGGDGGIFYQAGDPPPTPNYKDFDDDWDEWSPKIGFQYQYNDDAMVFGSYSEGFKSGGFFGRQANFTDVDARYDPEYVDSWELGLKSEWMDGRLIFNPTVFYNSYDDKQESILIGIDVTNVATVVRNASTLDIWGFEIEAVFQATEAWNIRASYGYIDAEYDDFFADLNGDGIETDNSDLTPRDTPENSFGLVNTYTIPVGNGTLSAMAAFRWRDEVYTLADNKEESHLDDITNLDMTVSYTWGDVRTYTLSAYGRNITDEREGQYAEISQLTGWSSWNQGENYGVEFSVSF